jgi:hypothetical protein
MKQVEWGVGKGSGSTSKQILIRYENVLSKAWSLCLSIHYLL